MKRNVVFLYSGQARSFDKKFKDQNGGEFSVWKSQLWQVVRHFPHALCFASVKDDQEAQDILRLKEMFDDPVIDFKPDPVLKEPEGASTIHQGATPYRISGPVMTGSLLQMASRKAVWDLYKGERREDDIIIRIRFDLFFKRFNYFPIESIAPDDAYAPFWGSYGGMNDRFGIYGYTAAKEFFTAFDHIDAMLSEGCPMHPETMQAYALERANCVIHHTLVTDFSTIRINGAEVTPVHLPIDQYLYNEG